MKTIGTRQVVSNLGDNNEAKEKIVKMIGELFGYMDEEDLAASDTDEFVIRVSCGVFGKADEGVLSLSAKFDEPACSQNKFSTGTVCGSGTTDARIDSQQDSC